MSSLLRSIQDCVQEVPVEQMAQGTPPQRTPRPSKVAPTGFINLSMAFLPSLKSSLFKIIFRHELFIVIIESQVLHQLLNVSKGDVPMALLPDPTTAASERSSVKNRLTGSRRRGSGINRHRSRTCSKTSLRGVQAQGAGASRGGCRARASATSRKTRKIRQTFRSCLSSLTRSIQDCVQEVPVGQMAQGTPSAHAAAFPGGFNRLHQLVHGFFNRVLSEVFSQSSSVMSSLLFL